MTCSVMDIALWRLSPVARLHAFRATDENIDLHA